MAMGDLRKKFNLHEPEGSMVGWQILLKGNLSAKHFRIETDGACLVYPRLTPALINRWTLVLIMQPFSKTGIIH